MGISLIAILKTKETKHACHVSNDGDRVCFKQIACHVGKKRGPYMFAISVMLVTRHAFHVFLKGYTRYACDVSKF